MYREPYLHSDIKEQRTKCLKMTKFVTVEYFNMKLETGVLFNVNIKAFIFNLFRMMLCMW